MDGVSHSLTGSRRVLLPVADLCVARVFSGTGEDQSRVIGFRAELQRCPG